MGDGEKGKKYIELMESDEESPHSPPGAIRIRYKIGPTGWAGIYWQNKPDNWGKYPGEDLRSQRYKKITFWARGARGHELVEFKAGGINAPGKKFRDSFEVSAGRISLTREWKKYKISLEGANLKSVIGGFCWVANDASNPKGLTFWLDDIQYE
jgi:hypothetical protein